MRMRMNPDRRVRLLVLAALAVTCLVVFRSYLFGQDVMVFNDIGSDTWQLYTMQYASIINHLREGTFSIWDFTNGFGINQFNLNLFDPSLMLVYGLGVVLGPAKAMYYLAAVHVLRILAAGWVMYLYLSCFSFSRLSRAFAAYAYGLSGYLLVWGQHYQFGMAVIYFPLILLFTEKALARRRSGLFLPAAVFLSGIYSVYFTYMSLAGAGVYLIFRVLMSEERTSGERLTDFLRVCGLYLLGLFMSMGVFLPMADCILLVSGRVAGENSQGVSVWQALKDFPFAVYLQSLLMRSLSSVLQNTGRLRDAYFETMYNYYEDPVLFCSTLAFFLDVQFCFLHRKRIASRRKRNVLTAAVVFMAVVLLFPAAGIVMNGFTYYTARYTFVLTPVFLLGMAWTLDEIRRGGRLSAPVLVISTAVLVVVCAVGYKQSVFWAYRNQAVVLLATGLLLAAVLFVFPRFAGGKREAWLLGALALLLAVNAGSEAASNFSDRVTLKRADTPADVFEEEYEEFERQAHSLNLFEAEMSVLSQPQRYYQDLYHSGVAEALDVVRSQDDSFYRVEKDYMTGSTTLAMDSLAQGYRGLSSYNSVQNAGILDFIDTCYPEVHYPDKNHLIFAEAMESNRMAAFLGVRYLLSTDAALDPEKYEKLGEFGAQILYRNRIPSSMVHFYDHAFSEDSLRKLSGQDTREDLLEGAVFLSEGEALASTDKLPAVTDAQKDSYAVLDAPEKDSYLTGQVHAEADGYLLFMIPYEAGWHLSVDGNETGLIRGDLGFLCCRIPAGDHALTLTFTAPGLKAGLLISLVSWILWIVILGIRRKAGHTGTKSV